MAFGINKACIGGYVGQDPDVRYTQSGAAVANVSIATTESWKDKDTGEKQERTEWHRVVFFNRLAEVVAEYVKKGQPIYIEGKIQTRKWEDKEGITRYSTEIVAGEMQMLPSGKRDGDPGQARADHQAEAHQNRQTSRDTGQQGSFVDDDIPF